MAQNHRNLSHESVKKNYPAFSGINGKHTFKSEAPGGVVEYRVRSKKGGKVAFFNFNLAKKMGLIPKNHPAQLTSELEKEILDTFSLVIINEYDIAHDLKFNAEEIRPETYMATRYLQLQHPDKSGRTSGDGRTIWNGQIRHSGVTWDISSCGTGATKLSPACNINKKFYQTGDPSISYGCGLADVSEGFETLFFSEVFAQNDISTERILAIIEFEKGIGINVRAHSNLIRPSHFFCHLKQGHYIHLKQVADYYLKRQIENGFWNGDRFKDHKKKYHEMAKNVASTFGKMAARFEDEYIFCWLDWDGDNILMDGGIIDYGSIRQFGLFHSEYRYDDVERFSTSILEQKQKARMIAQCFIQIADFLTTGKKKSISHFKNHETMKLFDQEFIQTKNRNLVTKLGLKTSYQDYILNHHLDKIEKFRKAFAFFERSKSKRGFYKVADGITRDAIFCMRDILRELPQIYLTRSKKLEHSEFLEIMKSNYAKKNDLKLTEIRKKQINKFQKSYLDILSVIEKEFKINSTQLLLDVTMRSSVINRYDRVTGNSITYIVDKVLKLRPRLGPIELFEISCNFSSYQNLNPDQNAISTPVSQRQKLILQNFHTIVRDCREGI